VVAGATSWRRRGRRTGRVGPESREAAECGPAEVAGVVGVVVEGEVVWGGKRVVSKQTGRRAKRARTVECDARAYLSSWRSCVEAHGATLATASPASWPRLPVWPHQRCQRCQRCQRRRARVTGWPKRASPRGATSAAVEPCVSRAQCPSEHIVVDVSKLIKAMRAEKRRASAAESQTRIDLTKCQQTVARRGASCCSARITLRAWLQRGWVANGCKGVRRCNWHVSKKAARL
jgi:hypothetical protein